MSHITRIGNLAAAPTLRHDDKGGAYCYARVIVTDRQKDQDGSYSDGPPIAYDVQVNGSEAEELAATAERSGNVRVMFSGTYRVEEYRPEDGEPRIQHKVFGANVAISLRGQSVAVTKPSN